LMIEGSCLIIVNSQMLLLSSLKEILES